MVQNNTTKIKKWNLLKLVSFQKKIAKIEDILGKAVPSITEAGISLLQFELKQHVLQTFWPNNHKVNTNITVICDTFLLSFCGVSKRNHFKSYQTLACLVTWRLL